MKKSIKNFEQGLSNTEMQAIHGGGNFWSYLRSLINPKSDGD